MTVNLSDIEKSIEKTLRIIESNSSTSFSIQRATAKKMCWTTLELVDEIRRLQKQLAYKQDA